MTTVLTSHPSVASPFAGDGCFNVLFIGSVALHERWSSETEKQMFAADAAPTKLRITSYDFFGSHKGSLPRYHCITVSLPRDGEAPAEPKISRWKPSQPK
ncbi:MAG: hypothetical protein ACUVSC_07835 [Candidatus Fervidibacter sp.]|uniref:hypothetical protein n=1 Tax=Candidatus Fervidibacter sp. TaxID=3100871 RepID=UPI00404B58ED